MRRPARAASRVCEEENCCRYQVVDAHHGLLDATQSCSMHPNASALNLPEQHTGTGKNIWTGNIYFFMFCQVQNRDFSQGQLKNETGSVAQMPQPKHNRPAWIDHDVNKKVGHYTVSRVSAAMVASPHVRPVSFACAEKEARAILGSTQSLGRHSAPIRPQVPAVLLCCGSPAVKSAAVLIKAPRPRQEMLPPLRRILQQQQLNARA